MGGVSTFIHKNYTLYFNLEKIEKHNGFLKFDIFWI